MTLRSLRLPLGLVGPGVVLPGRAGIFPALAFLWVALVLVWSVRPGSSSEASPAPSLSIAKSQESTEPAAAPRRAAPGHGGNVDALAAIIARKYRVSEEATRGVVAAAYYEGVRNGLDPLLLVAVMAVESRFNPIAQSDGGAVGLMQVIPRYHADKLDAADRASVLEPRMNIRLGAKVLKEYIARAGNEVAGLQLYNGSSADSSNAYANRVLGEKQWLQQAVRHSRERSRA